MKMAMANFPTTSDGLIEHMHNLPPELHNEIYKLTFSADFPEPCQIDNNYKPPSVLQVNRKWRRQLAEPFYDNTIFTVSDDIEDLLNLLHWLSRLPKEQLWRVTMPEFRVLSRKTVHVKTKADGTDGVRCCRRRDLDWAADEDAVRRTRYVVSKVIKLHAPAYIAQTLAGTIRYHFQTSSGGEVEFRWS